MQWKHDIKDYLRTREEEAIVHQLISPHPVCFIVLGKVFPEKKVVGESVVI